MKLKFKLYKRLSVYVLTIIMSLSIVCMSLLVISKNFVNKELMAEGITESLIGTIESNESIKKIQEEINNKSKSISNGQDKLNSFIDKYLNDSDSFLGNNTNEISDYLMGYAKDFANNKISESDFKNLLKLDSINGLLESTLAKVHKMVTDFSLDNVLRKNLHISVDTLIIVLGIITFLCFIILSVLKSSIIKGLKYLGVSLVISGVILGFIYFILFFIKKKILINTFAKIGASLRLRSIIYLFVFELIGGIILISWYVKTNKKEITDEEENQE